MKDTQRTHVLALLIAASALAATATMEVTSAGDGEPAEEIPAAATTPPTEQEIEPERPNEREVWLNGALARPLFSPDRKPIAATASDLPRLTGIIVDGPRRIAIFAVRPDGTAISAESGSRVGSYSIQDIRDDQVILDGPRGSVSVRPAFDTQQTTTAPVFTGVVAIPAFFRVPPQ